jgi:hypothetical protein
MAPTQPQELVEALRWPPIPWPGGDPPFDPLVWRVFSELDQRAQLRVAEAILDAHIAQAQARVDGLSQIKQVVAGGAKAS